MKEDPKKKDEEIAALKLQVERLSSRIATLVAAQEELKRTNTALMIENEELIEQRDNGGFLLNLQSQPAFLAEHGQMASYTEMTTHRLKSKEDHQNAARKQGPRKKKRK